MKYRTDFVTNSSSSSFIFAVHKDATHEDIKREVLKFKKDILSIMSYMDCESKDEEGIDDIVEDICNEITPSCDAVIIGDWKLSARSCSSEGGVVSAVIYDVIRIDTDKIKVKAGDY